MAKASAEKRKVTIKHFKQLHASKAMAVAVQAWSTMISEGVAGDGTLIGWDHQALVAYGKDGPIGIITFSTIEDNGYDIRMGYVDKRFRRCGVYRCLWDALVKLARKNNIEKIYGSVMAGNDRMRAVAKRLGRREHLVTLWFDVAQSKKLRRKAS